MFNRKGFTLIELLIVVVIIGILAAIAIPKFAATKEKAYLASMKSDLRNLATAQEGYFSDNTAYIVPTATNPGGGAAATPLSDGTNDIFVPSAGVTTAGAIGAGGWNATASHTQTAKQCYIFVGPLPGSPNAGVAPTEGEPRCDP